jgi:hypothetical protein
MTNSDRSTIAALRNSHTRLWSLVDPKDPTTLGRPSYCSEWTVAQVLSHIGSGAEIFTAIFDAALTGETPPGPDAFPPVWESWNANGSTRPWWSSSNPSMTVSSPRLWRCSGWT